MGLELYLDLLSQPCRAVYLFAKKNHIPFELKNVELFKDSILGTKVPGAEAEGGATRPSGSQHKENTRVKKVPILKDETFILSEGTAILLYLSRKYNTPDHWYPSDLQKRAKVDEYLSWHQATIRSNAPKTMWIKVLIPLLTGQPLPPEKLQEVMDGLATALDHFEGLFLQDKPFLVGSEVSLADLVAIVDLMQPVGVGCDIFKDRPRLAEWRKRTEDVIGKELFLQAHELILNIRQHFSEEFNKVNILRKVPVLKDGDFILEESTAILLYLTRKYNTPSYWYPPDMKKRARVDEYLAWQISTIRAGTSKILWLKVVIPLFVGHQVSPEKLYEAMEELNLAIQKLEDKFLQEKPFLIGPEISLADLVAIVELMQPLGAGCDILEGRPKLQEWRKRVELTLGKELFMEAHSRILNPQELKSIVIDPPLKAQMKPLLLKMLK